MKKFRARFKKGKDAVYISHLDMNRAFARAFSRAKIKLKFSEGFNPRPSFSFSMPLSLFYASESEYLDFEAEGEASVIKELLNKNLPSGIEILEIYEPERKLTEMGFFEYEITCFFEEKVEEALLEKMGKIFKGEQLMILKKSKRGEVLTDILPFIEKIEFLKQDERKIIISCMLSCGENTTLNPDYILKAIEAGQKEIEISFSEVLKRKALLKTKEIFA